MDAARRIDGAPVDAAEAPSFPIVIEKATLHTP